MATLLFIPTYNESENVERLHDQIGALGLDIDILFMDDGSPDGTGEILDRVAARAPRTTVVHRPGKLGVGSAHRAGIRYAYAKGYTTLVTMDSDFTHSPARIVEFLGHAHDSDVVLGSRFLRAESLAGWSPTRTFLTHLGHFLTRTLLRIPFDATGGFRVYRLDRIERRLFDLTSSDGYAFFFEILFMLCRAGAVVKELPIDLPKRFYGHSKMKRSDVVASLRTLAALFIGWPRTTRAIRAFRAKAVVPLSARADDL